MSVQHLHRYVDEFCTRRNLRKQNTMAKLEQTFSGAVVENCTTGSSSMESRSIVPPLEGGFEKGLSRLIGAPDQPLSTKSPLRYPGGKTRAVEVIKSYLPEGTKEIAAPFLGGASVELACAAEGMRVFGSDAFAPLMNFWKQAKANPVLLSERVWRYHPLTKPKYYSLQRTFAQFDDEFEQAAVFYVLNRSSFSGTTLSGGMSPGHPRFNRNAVDRLRDFM